MITYIFLGLREFRSGPNLSYEEFSCPDEASALRKTFEGLTIYKIIIPSPLPGKVPVTVIYHKDPDNELSRKYWPK